MLRARSYRGRTAEAERHTSERLNSSPKERGPACLGDRASHRARPSRRPCLIVTHTPALVESKLRFDGSNLLGVAPVTQQTSDGWGGRQTHQEALRSSPAGFFFVC